MKVVEGVARVDDVDAFVAELGDVGDEYGCAVQAFDADYVAGRAHLEAAVERANRAFERGENVASDRAVEILLYAAGRRQIRRALEMGVGEGEHEVVVVVDGEDESGAAEAVRGLLEAERPTLGGDEATLRAFFGVSDAEYAVVDDLPGVVRERVALLDVEK
ncbi:KEOPS complex subunit Cgi121 [Halobacterium litoreum]|uniref:KEOPS complex subunit Cgi121 n=1 Tax=Halobacterium litoreum TaxID=2039234 RepID=A0ABD5NFA8_9EURY|nr:KEOPS complex subunit Cgi121 [Halobacterium litoreum]UHH13211.1 KEOPS complex subunit Cgi121 [Halobacterium litoreum]